MQQNPENTQAERISIVIPVYRGEWTLGPLLSEIAPLTAMHLQGSVAFRVTEVILVHDAGPDRSDRVMEELARQYPFVRTLWLSRNFGQHAATLAGKESTTGDWGVTMDEDLQQRPEDIPAMLKVALETDAQLVYAHPLNAPPHGWVRNVLSHIAKWITIHILGNRMIGQFNSFRMIDGEIARGLSAYCSTGVFLDIALSWVVQRVARCPVTLREEKRSSGYSARRLLSHFWRLIMTSGTRPLRLIALMGLFAMLVAVLLAVFALWMKIRQEVPVQGWASLIIISCFFFGSILLALGVIAEYLALALNIAMGRPLYLSVSRAPKQP